jgi:hypothetical protein
LPHGNGHIPHHPFGLNPEEDAVFYIQLDRQPAIQTGGIDPNCFSREKPADCQRLEGSLTEPLLLAVDRQAILSREIVEGGKGDDIIGPRE